MTAPINSAGASAPPPGDLPGGRDPETPAEAAEQFEKVLVRRFVKVMTKDMFSTSVTGEEGSGWMKSQRGTQRDMMTDMLTDHLVESEALGISEKLKKDWGVESPSGAPTDALPPGEAAPGPSVDPIPSTAPADSPSHDGLSIDRIA